MPAPTPWKHAVTGGVGIVAGVALLSVDWTLAQLVAFVGLALVARGALHLVTSTPFVGFAGAFAVLDVAGDTGVGDQPWWLATTVFVVTGGVLGAVLVARSGGPLHDTVVTVGVLALLEGTRDVAEAALRARHAQRYRRVARAQSAAAA